MIFGSHNQAVERAAAFARTVHEGQTEFAGNPYIDHPARLASVISMEFLNEQYSVEDWAIATSVALLHDTAATIEQIEVEFGVEVAAAVALLTKVPGTLSNSAYIDAIATSGNRYAVAVKIADLRDHLRPGPVTEQFYADRGESKRKKYMKHLRKLEAVSWS